MSRGQSNVGVHSKPRRSPARSTHPLIKQRLPHRPTPRILTFSVPTPTGGARTWLTPNQVEQLRDVCLTDAVPTYLQDRNEALVVLAYDAGLRAGELVGLDVDHVDLDAGTVYLPTRIQKGDAPPATLALKRDTVRVLRRYLRDRWKDTPALIRSAQTSNGGRGTCDGGPAPHNGHRAGPCSR